MPEPLNLADTAPGIADAVTGFCGKLPIRGDFLNVGLPRSFVDPWHDWMQLCLPASRQMLADDWEPAWNEAPIWRFALSAGICGPDPVLGLWMPSVDRVGRHFPITFAAVSPAGDLPDLIRDGGGFLAAAEAAGLDALAQDLPPDEIERRIAPQSCEHAAEAGIFPPDYPRDGTVWWTDGGPRVAPATLAMAGLPDEAVFRSMLAAVDAAPRAGEGGP